MFSTVRFTPPRKRSVVRAQRSVVGRSRSKDLLIGRLTILVGSFDEVDINLYNYEFSVVVS